MLLKDKVAVVSGVGPGLGKEIALALVREGASVVIGARTESYLTELADEIEGAGGQVAFAPTDITDVEQCRRLVGTAVERFGRVDALANNAFRPRRVRAVRGRRPRQAGATSSTSTCSARCS